MLEPYRIWETEWKGKSHMNALRDRKIRNSKKKCVSGWVRSSKDEEWAGKLVQNDFAAMKEDIRQIKLGSGSTVCNEASTAVGTGASGTSARLPPGIAARYSENFVPRKMEFKGCATDYTRSSFHGIPMEEVAAFVVDIKQMIPLSAQRFADWEQTRTEQGNWPTKTMVSLWFKSETNLAAMIELLRVVKG